MVDLGLEFWFRELVNFWGGEQIGTLHLDQPLFVLVEDSNVDMLVAELAELNGFLQEASLPLAEGHVPVGFVFDLFEFRCFSWHFISLCAFFLLIIAE